MVEKAGNGQEAARGHANWRSILLNSEHLAMPESVFDAHLQSTPLYSSRDESALHSLSSVSTFSLAPAESLATETLAALSGGSTTLTFQNGSNGYTGTVDTYIAAKTASKSFGSSTDLFSDLDSPNGSGKPEQALIRFDNLFGTGAGQIPNGATIVSAQLVLYTTDAGGGATLHRLLTAFSNTSTWNGLVGGVSTDGVEAVTAADATVGATTAGTTISIDVTASLQAWAGGATNYGWLINPTSTNGWGFYSAEGSVKPQLIVEYTTEPNTPPVAVDDTATTDEDVATLISVLGNDSDADGNALTVTATGTASHGTVTINADNTLTYTPNANYNGADSFTYTISDGRGGSATATVNITVTPVNDDPVATDDSATTTAGTSTIISVLNNDSDVDGDSLSIFGSTAPAHGQISINADNTITYLPNAGYTGADSFEYTISDGNGGQSTATVNLTVNPASNISDSYIATTFTTTQIRNFEHDNASKSFYFGGHWWAVLPDGGNWSVHKFNDSLPETGAQGGWDKASVNLAGGQFHADVAFDAVNNKLYVLQYNPFDANTYLYKLSYSTASSSWTQDVRIQLTGGTSPKLTGTQWKNSGDLALGLDANGNPIVTAIGPSQASGSPAGLYLAYSTSSNLSTWGETTLDPNTTTSGGSNGDSRSDLINFTLNGQQMVGIVYSADNGSNDSWKIQYHAVSTGGTGSAYASGWTTETLNNTVSVDNHISVVSDGTTLYVAMKDAQNSVWIQKGVPGAWEAPVMVYDGQGSSSGPSRPTLVLDTTHTELYVFYQEHTALDTGSIFMKHVDTSNLTFNVNDLGTKILTTGSSTLDLIDPQGPGQNVGDETGGSFFLFARGQDASNIWYNDIILA